MLRPRVSLRSRKEGMVGLKYPFGVYPFVCEALQFRKHKN